MLRYALAFVAFATVASAQEIKYMTTAQECTDVDSMIMSIVPYGELPLFTGQVRQYGLERDMYMGNMMFGVNQDTGTWSLISLWPDGTACLVATGENFEPFGG